MYERLRRIKSKQKSMENDFIISNEWKQPDLADYVQTY